MLSPGELVLARTLLLVVIAQGMFGKWTVTLVNAHCGHHAPDGRDAAVCPAGLVLDAAAAARGRYRAMTVATLGTDGTLVWLALAVLSCANISGWVGQH